MHLTCGYALITLIFCVTKLKWYIFLHLESCLYFHLLIFNSLHSSCFSDTYNVYLLCIHHRSNFFSSACHNSNTKSSSSYSRSSTLFFNPSRGYWVSIVHLFDLAWECPFHSQCIVHHDLYSRNCHGRHNHQPQVFGSGL